MRIYRKALIALAAASVAMAMLAVAAPARVQTLVPGKSIRGVSIGAQPDDVKRALGKPDRDYGYSWNNSKRRKMVFKAEKVEVVFRGSGSTARVVNISTKNRSERTDGIGVGSTQAELARAFSGERCLKSNGFWHCYLGKWANDRVVTDFSLSSSKPRRVISVTLELVGG